MEKGHTPSPGWCHEQMQGERDPGGESQLQETPWVYVEMQDDDHLEVIGLTAFFLMCYSSSS